MTHAELMALPEWPTAFGSDERVIDGKRVRVAIAPKMVAMGDMGSVRDADGQLWRLGTYRGVRYRLRVNTPPAGLTW